MFLSSNGGTSWEQVLNGMPADLRVNAIATYDTLVVAGSDDGKVRVSHDGGATWYPVGDDLPGMAVLSVWAGDDYIYAGLNAGGVWRCPADILTGFEGQQYEQNILISPNPASSAVKINPGFGKGTLTVFHQSGSMLMQIPFVQDEIFIDVSGWEKGTYIVKADNGRAISSALLVVQ